MSQNKFVSLPALNIERSNIFLFLIVGLHLLALASVWFYVYFHISVNIILAVLVILSFFYYILYYKKLNSLKTIKYRQDGLWILGYEDKPLLVSVKPEYLLTEWLVVLRFKVGLTKTRTVPIFKDMLSPQEFKQLCVVLPYIQKIKNQGNILAT